jgi:hypothetical protein
MLKKNIDKEKRKERENWVPYYSRITEDKTKYSRKEKHKNKLLKERL